MERKNYLSIALAVFLALGLIIGGLYAYRSGGRTEIERGQDLIGGQEDAHGCLVAAGYSWCEPKEKCLRTWEEACAAEAVAPTDSDVDAIRQAFMDKYQKKADEIQVRIDKFDGSFARGGVKFAMLGQFGEGGIFLAYKDVGAWKLAFDGNGMISCSEMAKYDFPTDMTLGCYDENTGEVKPGAQLPNPASANCVAKGGELEMKTGEDGGQFGVCKFQDGSECEEWALLRGECEQAE